MEILVGKTGFVGRNLAAQHAFDRGFHSTDIRDAYGLHPDLLVYAGVRSEMFLASRYPQEDQNHILEAMENIEKIHPNRCILISTAAVYPEAAEGDENTVLKAEQLPPYGRHRLMLEQFVEQNVPNHLIVRLPAIYGPHLKKNLIYDYIHRIPALLTEKKLTELAVKFPALREYYESRGDGYFHVKELNLSERCFLKQQLAECGFSALNFTDSRSVYQFLSLEHLWEMIQTACAGGTDKINLVTPPLSAAEVIGSLSGKEFVNVTDKEPYHYNLHTAYSSLFGRSDGYVMSREQCLREIREFVKKEGGEINETVSI